MRADEARSPGDRPPRKTDDRRILLACNNLLMADHLADLWEILQSDRRLHFRVAPPRRKSGLDTRAHVKRRLPLKQINKAWARFMDWDLIIAADHAWRDLVNCGRCPTMRICHGIPSKRVDGEIYAFGRRAYHPRGHLRYTRMLVSSDHIRELGIATDPAFEEILVVAGNLAQDRLLSQAQRRREIRASLGFEASDVVVLCSGTSGPESLFQRYGDALLDAARRLAGEFRFVFCAHPREYRPKSAGHRVWGPYLEAQQEHGFTVRKPSESWIPYLLACDVILADHTSMALHGIPLRRPVIHVHVPDHVIERGGPIWRLREISPKIRADISDLRERIAHALSDYPFERYDELATELNSCPGEAADRHRDEVYDLLGLSPTVS